MAVESASGAPARRIEWTGAGGDYYLAVVVDDRGEVVEEFWGTQVEVRAWIAARPEMRATFAPMALGATRKRTRRKAPTSPPRLPRP